MSVVPVKIELTVGANTINGGTQMTVTALRFDQACLAAGDLTTCATTQKDPRRRRRGCPGQLRGDATITTTCAGITWASNLPAGGTSPNQLVFIPTPSLVIPAANPNFCTLSFNYTLVNHSGNVDPNQIIQIAGFNQTSSSTGDAVCNNATSSGASGTGTYSACPVCTPANECNTAACDTDTGACVQTPKSPSTACTDTDGDNCSAAGCKPSKGSASACKRTW